VREMLTALSSEVMVLIDVVKANILALNANVWSLIVAKSK
jgi:hypothetical protein